MKKYNIISILLVTLTFFFFSGYKVNASTDNIDINFDAHEHFNYFYEQVHNTTFYQFVTGKGDNFMNYLYSFVSQNSDATSVFFSYASDINSNYVTIPDNSYYAIVLVSNGYNYNPYLIYEQGKYKIMFPFNGHHMSIILFYDRDMNYLDYSTMSSQQSSYTLNFSTDDFTYIVGSFYTGRFSWATNSYSSNIRVTGIKIDNSYYKLKNLHTRNGFLNFLDNCTNFFTQYEFDLYDLHDLGLDYFLEEYAIKSCSGDGCPDMTGLKGIYEYSGDSDVNISVPDGFTSQSYSYRNRYFLIPNNLNCSKSDSLLYFVSSDTSTINLIQYDMLKDNFKYDNLQTYAFQLRHANKVQALSLNSIVDVITDNYYIIFSDDNFSSNTFYYNSSCYSVYSALSENDIEFVNINTGNEVVISKGEQSIIYEVSSNISDDVISDYDSSNSYNITSILSGAWSSIQSFVNSAMFIFTMVTNIFNYLPSSVASLFLMTFTLGMVIILWKIFRGG